MASSVPFDLQPWFLLLQLIKPLLSCTPRGGFKQRYESVLLQLPVPLVSQDLIAHWRFDEGQGSEAYDSTGFSSVGQCMVEQPGPKVWEDNMVLH